MSEKEIEYKRKTYLEQIKRYVKKVKSKDFENKVRFLLNNPKYRDDTLKLLGALENHLEWLTSLKE